MKHPHIGPIMAHFYLFIILVIFNFIKAYYAFCSLSGLLSLACAMLCAVTTWHVAIRNRFLLSFRITLCWVHHSLLIHSLVGGQLFRFPGFLCWDQGWLLYTNLLFSLHANQSHLIRKALKTWVLQSWAGVLGLLATDMMRLLLSECGKILIR